MGLRRRIHVYEAYYSSHRRLGDLIAYRCAASCEPMSTKPEREPVDFAIQRLDELMWKIIATTDVQEYKVFLSGGDNFRKLLYPEYKANRKDVRVPEYLAECQHFLIKNWNAEMIVGMEADDAIGIHHHKDHSIIVSIDKDFKQLEGTHYNFVKDLIEDVDEDEADYNFWRQMLMGDRADNIKGVGGIGEVKSERLLRPLTPNERAAAVLNLYMHDLERFTLNMKLLRILRSQKEYEDIIGELNENSLGKSEREESTETGARQDLDDISRTGEG